MWPLASPPPAHGRPSETGGLASGRRDTLDRSPHPRPRARPRAALCSVLLFVLRPCAHRADLEVERRWQAGPELAWRFSFSTATPPLSSSSFNHASGNGRPTSCDPTPSHHIPPTKTLPYCWKVIKNIYNENFCSYYMIPAATIFLTEWMSGMISA